MGKEKGEANRLILLYKGLKGKISVSTDDLIPKTRLGRNQYSNAFQTPIANTDVYKCIFCPETMRDWNVLPDSLISSAEDAEDCVAKFTSLVKARDGLPLSQVLVNDCRFGVSPVTYPDSFLLSVSQECIDPGACLVPYAIIFPLTNMG